jgi:hypothetical protein
MIGAGSFVTGVLLPAMKKVPGIELVGICEVRVLDSVVVAKPLVLVSFLLPGIWFARYPISAKRV